MKRKLLLFIVLLLAGTEMVWAQGRRISGQVLDETGEALPGVGVNVKGTSNGTATDADGKFEVDIPDGNQSLIFRSVGYATQEVAVKGDVVNVRMALAARELETTVVTANAIRREKRSLGYSTTQVTGNDLTQGGSTSPLNALVGKAAGVNITTTSNSPGSSSRIVLRGGSSLIGNNQALIVVDGVPINNSNFGTSNESTIGILSNQVDYGNRANDINPEDIESISVLKGPAATALYGAIASNGAIMITTKKGRRTQGATKTDVEVSSSYELSSILKLPDFQNQYGQGNIYEGIEDDRRENFSWGRPFDGKLRPWGQIIDGQSRVKPYEAQENNVRDFFDVGQTWNNNVAINGGNDQAAYRLSFGSVNSKDIFPGKTYDRYTVGFNGNANLTNKIYSSININYVKINADKAGNGQKEASVIDNLYQTPRDIPIREQRDLTNKFNAMDYVDSSGVHRYGYYGAYAYNPYYTLDSFRNTDRVDRVFGNIVVGYKPTSWLTISNRLAADVISDRRVQSQPRINSLPVDPLYDGNPHKYNGLYSQDIYNTANIYNDLMITFNKDIAKDLNLNWLVGHNVTQNRLENTFSSTNEEGGLIVPGYYDVRNTNGTPLTTNDITMVRRVGVYTNATFGYKNTAFIDLSLRNDWSSTVEKSYLFYGANASYVLSEHFSQSLRNTWNYSKLRISYGATGNDAPAYYYQTVYDKARAEGNFGTTIFPFNGIGGFSYDNRIGNPGIRPEISKEFEVGTEQAFWSNRFTVDFSWYSKRSEDQIVDVPIANSSGFSSSVINTGLVTNKGIELAVRVTPVQTASGFRWDLYGTYTRNKNEVKEIYPGTDQIVLGGLSGMSIVASVGRPYGTFYTTGQVVTADGKVVVDSATGLPEVSTTAQYYGTYLPDYQASWGTTLSYKGFTFNMLFDTKQGGIFYSRTRDVMGFVGTSEESGNRDEQVFPNSVYLGADGQYHENTTKYLPYTYYTSSGIRPNSDLFVNATYVKLREVSLTYTFPKKWFRKTFIGGASARIYGNNLAIWTPKSNKYVDPEVNSEGASNAQGFDFSAAPSQKRYGINLRFTF